MRTRSSIGTEAGARAADTIAAVRRRAPAAAANMARNARAEPDRRARWATTRGALWQLVDPLLSGAMRVAIVGAGNGDTIPLAQIADRVREVALIDLDDVAIRGGRRREPRRLRSRIATIQHDVTGGTADVIATAAEAGVVPANTTIPETPLPGSPYDLVIGDLLYSQLLYPPLLDLGVDPPRRDAFLARYGPILTRAVVSRLHASAPDRPVIHVHDPIAWWPGRPQPVTLEQILRAARRDSSRALALAALGAGPDHSDPRPALGHFAIPIRATAIWHWPFSARVAYLTAASVAIPLPLDH